MLWFKNDYSEGAHEKVLKRLCDTSRCHRAGYGDDEYSLQAKEKIRQACNAPDADVVFLTGGTQVNVTVIAAMLKPFEGALTAVTGHINCHEAGAVEFAGVKVLPLPQYAGKVKAEDVQNYLDTFYADESYTHMVFPGLLYISHPTEYGTLYTKAELAALRKACDSRGVRLFLDGARMAYGLAAEGTDVTLPDIAKYCHAFTIGGTKCGAYCGEAAVFAAGCMPEKFVTLTKQRGAMLAKGSLNGLQFDTLFTDDLYGEIGRHTIRMAMKLKRALLDKGYEMYIDSPTNQQFPIVDEETYRRLKEKVEFGVWERLRDGRIVIRLCTCWATEEQDLDELISLL